MTATEKLIERMKTYDGYLTSSFTIDYSDFDLITDADKEDSASEIHNPFVYAAYLASMHCETRQEAQNASRYLHAIIDDILEMNFSEASNENLNEPE